MQSNPQETVRLGRNIKNDLRCYDSEDFHNILQKYVSEGREIVYADWDDNFSKGIIILKTKTDATTGN